MKKTVLFTLVFLLLAGVPFVTSAEKEDAPSAKAAFAPFISAWNMDWAEADIWFSEGNIYARIEAFDCGYESVSWLYTCSYDEEKQILIASNTGIKSTCVYDDSLETESQYTDYRDGSAVFSIDDEGHLIWTDEKENAGKDLLFIKMGNYKGKWQCENTTIAFHTTGGIYRCFVTRDEGTNTAIQWTYSCVYDLDSGNVISNQRGCKEIVYFYDNKEETCDIIYDDGLAIFSIDDDGHLVWNDLKENAGRGLLFIKETTD